MSDEKKALREWWIRQNPAGESLDIAPLPCGPYEKLIHVIDKAAYYDVCEKYNSMSQNYDRLEKINCKLREVLAYVVNSMNQCNRIECESCLKVLNDVREDLKKVDISNG